MEMSEVQDRYRRVREEMANEAVDVLVVSGSEYTGFDGAVAYMSGFNIVHRYAYVLVPREGDLRSSFRPRRATSASTTRRGSTRRCSWTGRATGCASALPAPAAWASTASTT